MTSPSAPQSPPADRSARVRLILSTPFILAIRMYQVLLSPLMAGHCRFHPTCSH
ncbi:MAG: membrane protein insertion efficiency factor YidD, partial [Planctomyces sp.]